MIRTLPLVLAGLLLLKGHAQGFGLTLSPARLELEGALEGSAQVQNDGEGVVLEVGKVPFVLGLDGQLHLGQTGKDLCPELEVLPVGRVALERGGRMELRLRVRPFQGEGTYWCAVSLKTLPPPAREGLRVLLQINLLLPVYYTFAGTGRPRLEVEGFGRAGDELQLNLANAGNVLLRLSGSLVFYEASGREALRIPLSEGDGLPLLPGGRRLLSFRPGLPPGYKVLLLLDLGPYGRKALEAVW
ncbi:MAG: hypothetical protein C4298_07015 [Thermus sp.]